VKEKARLNLLQEFENKIYAPKEKDKTTGLPKPALLKKGKDTFQLVERYLLHYDQLLGGGNYDLTGGDFQFDNLIKVMLIGLPATDWIPPLLSYFVSGWAGTYFIRRGPLLQGIRQVPYAKGTVATGFHKSIS
jgi:hypothetical protein